MVEANLKIIIELKSVLEEVAINKEVKLLFTNNLSSINKYCQIRY